MVTTDESMETILTNTNNIKIQTFIFEGKERDETADYPLQTKIWQIFPSSCAYLVSFIFGMMLGWSSPTYPRLLLKEAEIPINMDQTALIAGFLMIGNMFGVLPANFVPFISKYGMITGLISMLIGWLVLWQANNIYCLLASRFLIGFGSSFGTHHGKEYIKQMSGKHVRDNLVKSAQIYTGFGVLAAYLYGPHVDFKTFSVISLITTAVICVLYLFLPHSPIESIRLGKIVQAKVMLEYLKPGLDVEMEIRKLKLALQKDQVIDWGLEFLESKVYRSNLIMLVFLTLFQQFCGVPSTLIYCMVLLEKLSYPHSEILAVIYVLFFLLGNAIGSFYLYQYNMKYCLLLSSVLTSIILILNTLIIYFKINEKWVYFPYVLLILFIFCHSIGFGPLPFLLTPKLFPQSPFAGHVQTIFYSIWAIVVTKIFQVLISNYLLYVSFIMFSISGVLGSVFILIFIPSDLSKLKEVRNKNSKSIMNNTI